MISLIARWSKAHEDFDKVDGKRARDKKAFAEAGRAMYRQMHINYKVCTILALDVMFSSKRTESSQFFLGTK